MSDVKNLHDRKMWPELMAKAQGGDQKAYCQLLQEIAPAIRAYLMKRISQKDQVEDIVQDVLLAIHQVRHTYQPAQPFDNWMYGIAHHKMIDFIRKYKRRADNEITSEAEIETFVDLRANSKDQELPHDLETALNSLPAKQRKIMVMTKIEGYTMAEIADKMGMTESAVKVSAHRAYKKIKARLVAYGSPYGNE